MMVGDEKEERREGEKERGEGEMCWLVEQLVSRLFQSLVVGGWGQYVILWCLGRLFEEWMSLLSLCDL